MLVQVDKEMRDAAEAEAKRRSPYINHHFEVGHMDSFMRDVVGFLGEFCACKCLGIDWKANIRENYFTIDSGDGVVKGKLFDVKTETLPKKYFDLLVNSKINDDEAYGRRLINAGQISLLHKYQIVIFGAFNRDDLSQWCPLGYAETGYILKNYTASNIRPYGGTYPFSAIAFKTTELKCINDLLNVE